MANAFDQNQLFSEYLTFSLTYLGTFFCQPCFVLVDDFSLKLTAPSTHASSVLAENDIKGTDTSVSVISENKMTNTKQMSDLVM